MKISNRAYAMLYVGQTVGVELTASKPELRAWVVVYPRVKKAVPVGDEYIETESDYAGVGTPIFRVLSFEIEASAVEQPTFDYDHHMSNVRRIEISSEAGFDEVITMLEAQLDSWGIDPSALGALGDDYPVI